MTPRDFLFLIFGAILYALVSPCRKDHVEHYDPDEEEEVA